ncbi:hypothetical protein BDV96DRAFT_652606 [Lophiotrema nucula]|uniref:Rhodopsin domain-containing protein n=1 Tax=Lophiotrema nucula TaxID=690887 RepID=A0A6A5YQI0_9PLEO|nr:hypothetical protein BDV96DRAFT_652606 [Lophiotrema nucula]
MGANNSIPANYDAPAYAILVLDILLTTLAVVGRTVSRRIQKATPASDDWLAYVAYSANLGLLVSGILLTASGALNLDDVSHGTEDEKHFVRSAYNSLAVLYVFSITFIKCSILFFFRRTFTMLISWFRYAWWSIFTLVLLWTATCIILLALQGADKLPKGGFSRLGISITGIVNAVTDFFILGLPIFMISRMKLQRKQKLALISIFMLGGIASIVSIVRGTIFFINRAHQLNEAYSNYLDIVLTATESSIGLICACLPLTKPIVVRFTKWVQRLRGIDTEHQGWTTMSASGSKSLRVSRNKRPGEGIGKGQSLPTIDDDGFEVQLLPVQKVYTGRSEEVERGIVVVETPVRTNMERGWGHER